MENKKAGFAGDFDFEDDVQLFYNKEFVNPCKLHYNTN